MKKLLIKQNVQWETTSIQTGNRRELLGKIQDFIDVKYIVAIAGARRSGKSYLFRQIMAGLIKDGISRGNILQVNFEDPFFINLRESPDAIEASFTEYLNMKNPSGRIYIFLDEIQNITGWQFWVRDIYDRLDHVKMFITGSNSELLSNELATHLTGRVIAFENFPYSYKEYFTGLNSDIPVGSIISNEPDDIYQKLFAHKSALIYHIENSFTHGLFPENAYLEDRERTDYIHRQYFQNVLFSDIIPRFSVRNTKVIEQLAYYCSTNITSPFSYHRLAEAVGSNENTVKEYMSYFERAYLFFELGFFEYSLKKQFRRNRKIYCIDNGLRHATSNSFSEDAGKYAENAVFIILRRHYQNIFYWQDGNSQREIDFVVFNKNVKVAINVSYTDDLPEREFKAFDAFASVSSADRYIIISRDTFARKNIGNIEIEIVPFWLFIFTGPGNQ